MAYKTAAETVLLLVLLAFLASVSTREPVFLNKNNQVFMEAGLKNPIVVKSMVKCFLDDGPCSSTANKGKQFFQQNYTSKCANCTEEQKKYLKKFCSTFYSMYKEDYDKIVEKYDPNRENREAFQAWLNATENYG